MEIQTINIDKIKRSRSDIDEEREREREEYGLSVVPRNASVNVNGESGSEVNGSNTESCCECLERIIPNLTRYSHFRSNFLTHPNPA